MKDEIKEIKVNKANKSITFINNGIAFSQFGVADEILDLITNLQEENDRLKEYQESYRKELDFWRIQFSNEEQRIDKTINKLNDLINIENKESPYDRFFGDNTYLINER